MVSPAFLNPFYLVGNLDNNGVRLAKGRVPTGSLILPLKISDFIRFWRIQASLAALSG